MEREALLRHDTSDPPVLRTRSAASILSTVRAADPAASLAASSRAEAISSFRPALLLDGLCLEMEPEKLLRSSKALLRGAGRWGDAAGAAIW